jgi:hypothetical protein
MEWDQQMACQERNGMEWELQWPAGNGMGAAMAYQELNGMEWGR